MNTETKDRISLMALIAGAFLPLALFMVFVGFRLRGFGGPWLNLSNVAALIWIIAFVIYWKRQPPEKQPLWLLALGPFALMMPILFSFFWMWGKIPTP
jgi:hypothetical protein